VTTTLDMFYLLSYQHNSVPAIWQDVTIAGTARRDSHAPSLALPFAQASAVRQASS
jgi:hypothetical protein